MIEEREAHGRYKNLKDFMERLTSKEINKRTIENLIKAGALDSLGATRRQMMMVYACVLDEVNREKKENISGQMSLFDFFSEEEKKEYEIQYPDVGEFEQSQKLAFEKEVLGIYVSGHPLQDYMSSMEKQITARSTDFEPDEETGLAVVKDGRHYIVGGLISNVTVKLTKTNQNMAFVTLEDLYGTVEVILFPRDYQKYRDLLVMDTGVYVRGPGVSFGRDRQAGGGAGALHGPAPERGLDSGAGRRLFPGKTGESVSGHPAVSGDLPLVIYSRKEKAIKRLPAYENISDAPSALEELASLFGEKISSLLRRVLKNSRKRDNMTSEEPDRMAILTARLQVVSRQFDNWESDSARDGAGMKRGY